MRQTFLRGIHNVEFGRVDFYSDSFTSEFFVCGYKPYYGM
ncbi:hypothetical protein Mahau_2289 [Mahella australiensis 50-1 BON]|uniref:Uncharacterized protein n=1 Tax=Mahella australiensis (strain DSM 15567 / CIP 107919 / 50-1 BON) TaxID=697281 RepID=F3ZVR3_MAHA5|nr:hypothetical protein Mahau_2289 [Mahella australiensis 50-1 BON]